MGNYTLEDNEVVLSENTVHCSGYSGAVLLTLTSLRLILEQEKGVFKKTLVLLDIFPLSSIKTYQDNVQIKQKGEDVSIQMVETNLDISFSGLFEAKKFVGKAVTAATGCSAGKRFSSKTIHAIELVDETLGLDSREMLKGVLQNGVKGTLLNGLKKKK